MQTVRLSTRQVEERERVAFWSEVVCTTFVELDCTSRRRDGFFGSIDTVRSGDVQISRVASTVQDVARRRANIARSDQDFFLVSLQTAGSGTIEQDGRTAILRAGDLTLYDTTRPYALRFHDAFGQLVLRLPRAALTHALPSCERMTATRIAGRAGTGLLAATFIGQLHRSLADVAPGHRDRLNGVAIELVAAAISEQTGVAADLARGRFLLQERVRDFVDRHYRDPNLDCDTVAVSQGISARYMRKVFEAADASVAELIWNRRLDHASRELRNPARAHLSVSSIAYGSGFKDTGHFSRAFRRRFGVPPSAVRARGGLAGSA